MVEATPQPTEAATESPAENTAAPAKVRKRASKKAAVAKPAKKAPKAESNGHKKRGPSIRLRVFQMLHKHENGLTGLQIKEKLGTSFVPAVLKDEGVCEKPRIRRQLHEGTRAVVYVLSALGKKHLEQGKVDEEAAPSSYGTEWPEGR